MREYSVVDYFWGDYMHMSVIPIQQNRKWRFRRSEVWADISGAKDLMLEVRDDSSKWS